MCEDIPNAFIQAEMSDISDGKERVTMKITGVLVDMLVQLSPKIYGPYVVFEKQRNLQHSTFSRVTKEKPSVSTKQTKDNKATKNRSMIIISSQRKGWRKHKAKAENIRLGNFLREISFSFLYVFICKNYIGAQRTCLGEETSSAACLACLRAGLA